jgi:hypothetical protein
MEDVIDEMMIAIFAQGHCLLVGGDWSGIEKLIKKL